MTKFVLPVFFDDETFRDHLFFSDSDGASLHFENAATKLVPDAEPCASVNLVASPLEVTIKIKQPDEMSFVDSRGLDETFLLYPEEQRDIPIRLRRLLEDFNIDPATENRLLGATVSLRGTVHNPETGVEVVMFDQEIFSTGCSTWRTRITSTRRWTRAHAGRRHRRRRARQALAPRDARRGPADDCGARRAFRFGTVGDTTIVQFDPATAGEHSGRLELSSSNGPVGNIDLHGTASAKQVVAFSRAAFRDALALVVDSGSGPFPTSRDAFIVTFPDSDIDGLRSDDPAFDGIVNTIYDMAVSGFENVVYGFDAVVNSAINIVTAPPAACTSRRSPRSRAGRTSP